MNLQPGIVLVGAPGSGKTTVATFLSEHYGYRYIDREAQLVARYGSREAFLAVKEAAVTEMQQGALAWMNEPGAPWIYESTALTEADFVRSLGECDGFLVRLGISQENATRRVLAREGFRNLQNSAEATQAMWRLCAAAHSQMTFAFSVEVDDLSPPAVAEQVHSAFTGEWRTPRRV